jgi:MobA/MobL family
MPSYHLSVKTISRSAGRSATAAAAYRAGVEIADQRTGELHDYTRKGGVEYIKLVLPENAPSWSVDRDALWNAAEQAETRKNSTVAREFEVALPSELSAIERQRLALDFAQEIVERHGCAADIAIHAPGKGGDTRNHHAHILCSTRKLTKDGFGQKTRELDDRSSGEVVRWRERFAELQNQRFRDNGIDASVDHRSLEAQGIDREPTRHLGVAATGYERRTGQASRKRLDFEKEIAERLARAKELGDLEREAQALERSIIDLSGDLKKAKADSLTSYKPLFDWIAQTAAEDGYNERERAAILAQAKERLIQHIESGAMPRTNTKTRLEFEAPAKLAQQAEGRQPTPAPQPAAKPGPPQGELAGQTLNRLIEAERLAWRKNEEKRLLEDAEQSRQAAWKLKAKEPKKPLLGLYATDKWKSDIAFWEHDLQKAIDQHHAYKKQAQDTIAGKSEQEHWHWVAFHEKAEQRLTTEHPGLAKALFEQRQSEQHQAALATAKAAADKAADKAVAGFKALATKREGKFLGYGDNGTKWGALPGELKAAIEHYNNQPATARGILLERMRRDFKREPDAAEKLTQQLGQGQDRGIVR